VALIDSDGKGRLMATRQTEFGMAPAKAGIAMQARFAISSAVTFPSYLPNTRDQELTVVMH
jgi:hypothetical protein